MRFENKFSKENDVSQPAPQELRDLAGLELRRRRLRRELLNVECQYRQLQLEIELKGIQIPWMAKL